MITGNNDIRAPGKPQGTLRSVSLICTPSSIDVQQDAISLGEQPMYSPLQLETVFGDMLGGINVRTVFGALKRLRSGDQNRSL